MHLKKIFVLILSSLFSSSLFAKAPAADDIVGFWLSEKGTGVVQVSKEGEEFIGNLVWIKDIHEGKIKEKLDENNPEEKLQKRSLLGLKMLHGFKFEDGEWSDGKIYDPESGKTYDAFMKLEGADKLKLKGFVLGMRFLGRSSYWTRQKTSIPDSYNKAK